MNKTLSSLLAISVALTTACSNMRPELDGFHEGWRQATVLEVGTADTLKIEGPAEDCRTSSGVAGTDARFAVTSYKLGGRTHFKKRRIVAVPEGFVLQTGDQVAINLNDCRLPLRALKNTP